MENQGPCRKSFSLFRRPPKLFRTKALGGDSEVPVFEPYEENLPLESGYYTFVIDRSGKFRIRRGNTSSHATFVGGDEIGGAGHLRINRSGSVAEVFCISRDYRITVKDRADVTVRFVIDSFLNHHAFEVSPHAIFRFSRGLADNFLVSIEGEDIRDLETRLELLESEGQGQEEHPPFGPDELEAFASYVPTTPTRLYSMHQDQLIINLEDEADFSFEYGPAKPRYAPDQPRLTSGKKAFIIDSAGWLVVGHGHHILSGGAQVGAAGQFTVEPSGMISEINLNFSGHYRPPLDADYARFTYRALAHHPLLNISPDCRISGRKFEGEDVPSVVLRFATEELESDDIDLDFVIECLA